MKDLKVRRAYSPAINFTHPAVLSGDWNADLTDFDGCPQMQIKSGANNLRGD